MVVGYITIYNALLAVTIMGVQLCIQQVLYGTQRFRRTMRFAVCMSSHKILTVLGLYTGTENSKPVA